MKKLQIIELMVDPKEKIYTDVITKVLVVQ